jgi:hypothetical protein
MKNPNLKHETTEYRIQITFCKPNSCCPSITLDKNENDIIIGGEEEGYTKFTKEQFKMFVEEVKHGTFDTYL